jgi:hypothetical protein
LRFIAFIGRFLTADALIGVEVYHNGSLMVCVDVDVVFRWLAYAVVLL